MKIENEKLGTRFAQSQRKLLRKPQKFNKGFHILHLLVQFPAGQFCRQIDFNLPSYSLLQQEKSYNANKLFFFFCMRLISFQHQKCYIWENLMYLRPELQTALNSNALYIFFTGIQQSVILLQKEIRRMSSYLKLLRYLKVEFLFYSNTFVANEVCKLLNLSTIYIKTQSGTESRQTHITNQIFCNELLGVQGNVSVGCVLEYRNCCFGGSKVWSNQLNFKFKIGTTQLLEIVRKLLGNGRRYNIGQQPNHNRNCGRS